MSWGNLSTPWTIFCIYFAIGARRVRVKRSVPTGVYLLESFGVLVAGLLLLVPATNFGILSDRFHHNPALGVAGYWLAVVGLLIASWSRYVLGTNWSARPIIQESHELVVAGPYGYVRHPLYTGLLVAFAGTALACGTYGALLGFLALIAIFAGKGRREERLLEGEFGSNYQAYRSHTGFLLPRVTRS